MHNRSHVHYLNFGLSGDFFFLDDFIFLILFSLFFYVSHVSSATVVVQDSVCFSSSFLLVPPYYGKMIEQWCWSRRKCLGFSPHALKIPAQHCFSCLLSMCFSFIPLVPWTWKYLTIKQIPYKFLIIF